MDSSEQVLNTTCKENVHNCTYNSGIPGLKQDDNVHSTAQINYTYTTISPAKEYNNSTCKNIALNMNVHLLTVYTKM